MGVHRLEMWYDVYAVSYTSVIDITISDLILLLSQ